MHLRDGSYRRRILDIYVAQRLASTAGRWAISGDRMLGSHSLRIGKILGIPVDVHVSWLLIFALLVFALASSVFPALPVAAGSPLWLFIMVAVATAVLFFGSILAHELCHSLVARAQGSSVDGITLFLFGGVARMDEEPTSPGREFLMAAAGPAMSLFLAAFAATSFVITRVAGSPWWVWAPLQYLAGVNFFVGVFNLLPGFPLDGGRVLRSILWAATRNLLKATYWASTVGRLIGWLMVAVGAVGVLDGRVDYLWFGFVGWFIATIAADSYRQQFARSHLEGILVRRVMTPHPQTVPGDISVERLVSEYLLGGPHSRYPVLLDGEVIGLVSLGDVKMVDRGDWPFIRVADVAERDLDLLVVEADGPANTAAQRLTVDRPGALLVADGGRLAGIVTRTDLVTFLRESSPGE